MRPALAPKAHKLTKPRPAAAEVTPLPGDESEPKPEELAKEEEAVKAEEVEEAAVVAGDRNRRTPRPARARAAKL